MIWVTVLTHNRLDELQRLLSSPYFEQDLLTNEAGLLVLNQGSEDFTSDYLNSLRRKSLVLYPRYFWNAAQNAGIVQGHQRQVDWLLGHGLRKQDIIVFLDDDAYPIQSGWLATLTAPIRDGRAVVTGAYGVRVTEGWEGYANAIEPGEVDVVNQSHTAVAGHIFLSGFEFPFELGRCWHEDTFLCLWAKERGYRVWYVGDAESIGLHHDPHHKQVDELYLRNWELARQRFAGLGVVLWEKELLCPTR